MVKINKETCIGCGSCASICPKVFEMKESKATIKQGQSSSDEDCVQEAIDACPVNAISK